MGRYLQRRTETPVGTYSKKRRSLVSKTRRNRADLIQIFRVMARSCLATVVRMARGQERAESKRCPAPKTAGANIAAPPGHLSFKIIHTGTYLEYRAGA